MALPSTAVWEVRSSTGNDANGGFYNSARGGSDYSQQDSPQLSLTDVVTNGTTTVTSSTGGFTSAMVGNGINIANTIYEITARTDTNTITIDRTAGSASGQTGKVGGAIATLSKLAANEVANNIAYLKGTFTLTSGYTRTASSTTWIGYTSTRTDAGKATITSSTNSVPLMGTSGGSCLTVNVTFTHTAATRGVGVDWLTNNSFGWTFRDCIWDGCSYGLKGDNLGNEWQGSAYLINCEIKNCTANGINLIGATYTNCKIHDNAGHGVFVGYVNGESANIIDTEIYKNGGAGILVFSNSNCTLLIKNSVIDRNSAHGLSFPNSSVNLYISQENTIYSNNTGYGINFTSTGNNPPVIISNRNNAYFGNTIADRTALFPAGTNDVALSVDPFSSSSTGVYTLNSTSGGGAALKAAGFSGITGTNHLDIGALQSSGSGGGIGNGDGPTPTTFNIKSGGNNIVGMLCFVSTDSVGGNVVAAPVATDASGNVTFNLNTGNTYYIWGLAGGYEPFYGKQVTA